jgi:hypothetical protein
LYDKSTSAGGSDPVKPKFGFVEFESHAAKLAALGEDGKIWFKSQFLHIEDRKPKNNNIDDDDRKPKNNSTLGSDNWRRLCTNFDWRHSAAQYLHRTVTMEDYLNEFIHTLASVRQVIVEDVNTLMHKLISLADVRPADLHEMLPPNLSGMVYNLIEHEEGCKKLDVAAILKTSPNLFTLKNGKVFYEEPLLTKEKAVKRLHEILVEGLFIYFFAKFCHGKKIF